MAPDTDLPMARAVELLEQQLHPSAIVLFGSRAGGQVRPDSDFDLGVLCGRPLPDPFTVARLKTDLEDILGGSVDLVVLDTTSPILAMDVLRAHRVLAIRDAEAFETFMVRTLMAYFDLKRVREPIERAILSRETPT